MIKAESPQQSRLTLRTNSIWFCARTEKDLKSRRTTKSASIPTRTKSFTTTDTPRWVLWGREASWTLVKRLTTICWIWPTSSLLLDRQSTYSNRRLCPGSTSQRELALWSLSWMNVSSSQTAGRRKSGFWATVDRWYPQIYFKTSTKWEKWSALRLSSTKKPSLRLNNASSRCCRSSRSSRKPTGTTKTGRGWAMKKMMRMKRMRWTLMFRKTVSGRSNRNGETSTPTERRAVEPASQTRPNRMTTTTLLRPSMTEQTTVSELSLMSTWPKTFRRTWTLTQCLTATSAIERKQLQKY